VPVCRPVAPAIYPHLKREMWGTHTPKTEKATAMVAFCVFMLRWTEIDLFPE
jgi:hypothetical protein